ncbi:MAG: EscU/YscU/HrcU family type III secretion system export apparatus switch protein [Desulfatiglandaceae bacterium]|jgi:flagellar biosynthesis protein
MEKTRKRAVALKYDPHQDNAPRLAAKGIGAVAEKIIELAAQKGIPVREDPDLMLSLMELDWHEEIPPALYQIIAEVLAFTYRMNRKYGSG